MTLGLDADDVLVGAAAALSVLGVWAALEHRVLTAIRRRWAAIVATMLAAMALAVIVEDVLLNVVILLAAPRLAARSLAFTRGASR